MLGPESVVANPDGSFSYQAFFVVGPGPTWIQGGGVTYGVNTDGTSWHGDGFCVPTHEEGYVSDFTVEASLVDVDQQGWVAVWTDTHCTGDSDPALHQLVTTILRPGETTTPTGLGLHQGRFQVFVRWRAHDTRAGSGYLAPHQSDESGIFWFFTPENWEFLVKVLDGCAINGHYWVFAAATTDVEYTLYVIDTDNRVATRYENSLGDAARPIVDTSAFVTCE